MGMTGRIPIYDVCDHVSSVSRILGRVVIVISVLCCAVTAAPTVVGSEQAAGGQDVISNAA